MQPMSAGIIERVATVSSLAEASRSATPPLPRTAKIEITSACDLDCYFCAHARHARPASEMSLVLFIRLARKLRECGVEQLGLFYIGESMLCRWLPEAIDFAKRECGYPYVFVTTNGLAATPQRVRECMLAGLDSLKFALNFSGATQFQALAGGLTEDVDVLVGNVEAARRIRDELAATTGQRCALYGSSLLYDERQRERMRKLLSRLRPHLDEHYWLPLYGHCGLPHGRSDTPVNSDAPPPRKPVPCWSLFTQAHVTVDGKLSACSLDASARFHVGDLTTTPFTDAWHSARFQALRAAHLRHDVSGTVCEKCIAYP